jgi:hypothetical protein
MVQEVYIQTLKITIQIPISLLKRIEEDSIELRCIVIDEIHAEIQNDIIHIFRCGVTIFDELLEKECPAI